MKVEVESKTSTGLSVVLHAPNSTDGLSVECEACSDRAKVSIAFGPAQDSEESAASSPRTHWIAIVMAIIVAMAIAGCAIGYNWDMRVSIAVFAFVCAAGIPLSTAFDKAEPQKPCFSSASALALVVGQCTGILTAALVIMQYIVK